MKKKILCILLTISILIGQMINNENLIWSVYATEEVGTLSEIEIEKQPQDFFCEEKDTAKFEVGVKNKKVTYQWEYSRDGIQWQKVYFEGYNTAVMSVDVVSYRFNYYYRCKLGNESGQFVYSEPAQILHKKPEILSQPENCYCAEGDVAVFNVSSMGKNIKYQWEYSRDGIQWQKVYFEGYNTSILSVEAISYRFNYQYRCKITDAYRNEVISDSVRICRYKITSQPETVYSLVGNTAKFSVKVEGNNLSYSWEYSKRDGQAWSKIFFPGHSTDTLEATMTDARNGYQFRCVVTDANNNQLISDIAYFYKAELEITKQPEDAISELEEDIIYTIKAEGEDVKYNWQYSKNGVDWLNVYFPGHYTEAMTVYMTKARSNYQFRCIVSDKYGNSVISDVAKWIDYEPIPEEQAVFENYVSNDKLPLNKQGEVLVDSDTFYNKAITFDTLDSETASVFYNINQNDVAADDIMMLRFSIQSMSSSAKIRVLIDGEKYTEYYISTQKMEIRVPIFGYEEIYNIKFELISPIQKIKIGDIELINYNQSIKTSDLEAGYFLREEYKKEVYGEEEGIGAGLTRACLTNGNYLYTLGRGELLVWKLDGANTPKKVAGISGLGDTRDMKFCKNKDIIAVTSRAQGVFFVNVSDVKDIKIASRYDTLEQVSGLSVYGNYAFLCSRYFGVEIVDITDISAPELVAIVSSQELATEYIDCYVSEGYLYVGAWGQKRVDVYDVRDLSDIQLKSKIETDGNVHGCTVKDGILYVSTGFHSRSVSTDASKPGYGMGNGIEIYDVSVPETPEWLSTNKVEGRFYCSGNDIWKVEVEGNYAYFVNTYNGLYIYDVTDKKNPKRLEQLEVRINKDSENYKKMSGSSYVFPYDTSEYMTAPITNICVGDGYLYLSGSVTDAYVYAYENAFVGEKETPIELKNGTAYESELIEEIPGYSMMHYKTKGSVYAAIPFEEYYAVACGTGGLQILNSDLEQIAVYETSTPVKDVKYKDGKLYTAEMDAGLGVYTFDNETLKKIGTCNEGVSNLCLTSIEISPNGDFVVGQATWTGVAVFNVSVPEKPIFLYKTETGSMYYRNVVRGLVSGKYIGVIGNNNSLWYGEDEKGQLEDVKYISNSFWMETNGAAACDDNVVVINSDGYVYYNPKTTEYADISSLEVKKAEGVKLRGKPAIYEDLMIVSTGYDGNIAMVDISDIDNPKLIQQVKVSNNVDVAYMDENEILLPLRHGGLLKLTPENQ